MRYLAPVLKIINRNVENLQGAEIGVHKGDHALKLLEEVSKLKLLILIDPYTPDNIYKTFDGQEKFKEEAIRKLAKHKERITWLFQKSGDALRAIGDYSTNKDLDFIYIDGQHTYKDVSQEMELSRPLLKQGALLCGHDYDHEEVQRAVDDFIKYHNISEDRFIVLGTEWFIRWED